MFELQIPFLPEEASTIAGSTDLFTFSVIGLGLSIGIVVVIVLIYFTIKYRSDSDADRSNPVEEHTLLEIGWSFIPLVLVLTIFVWSANIYFNLYSPPPDTLNISVIGKQWMWKAQHPDGKREINELHVPVGQPVKLTITSQDVIHSYFIPAFRLKQDAVPGRFTTMWFEATKIGEYHLLCAEYCGTEHALMVGKVYVMEPAEYEAWLRTGESVTVANSGNSLDAGENLFTQQGCITCHKLEDDASGLGPSLIGLFGSEVELDSDETITADEEYIRESIINPQAKLVAGYSAIMPSYQGQLSEEQVLQLLDYIRSLESADETAINETSDQPAMSQLD